MKFLDHIKSLNKEIEPYYLLITMLIFFLFGFISITKFLLAPPDVLVTVKKENINYPSSINENYSELFAFIQDSTKNEKAKNISFIVYNYLIKTKNQWTLEIQNNTGKKIKSINIRMSNVKDLTSRATSSSFLLDEESQKLLNNITFQEKSGIVYFKDAVDLPPNASLKIYLWGEFNNYDWMESLVVDYEDGVAKIEYPETFIGWKAIVANYFLEIILFIMITFIVIYMLQIKKYVNPKETSGDGN
jgi:hypothetical protein